MTKVYCTSILTTDRDCTGPRASDDEAQAGRPGSRPSLIEIEIFASIQHVDFIPDAIKYSSLSMHAHCCTRTHTHPLNPPLRHHRSVQRLHFEEQSCMINAYCRQARSQYFEGEGPGSGSRHQKGPGYHPWEGFEKRTCDLVHYITSVESKSLFLKTSKYYFYLLFIFNNIYNCIKTYCALKFTIICY